MIQLMVACMLNFVEPGAPLLNQVSSEVTEIDSTETQEIIDQMFEIARGERTDIEKRVMVGLAAPQVGIMKRIILVDMNVDSNRSKLGNLQVFINPEIIWSSDEKEEGREGCYSVDGRVNGIVSRPSYIKIRAFDRDGERVELELSHFTARIFQHEVDHLNGIRFPDRVGKHGKLKWVEPEEFQSFREQWKEWPVNCAWETWEAMREGRPYQ